jgi:hypothetical protein
VPVAITKSASTKNIFFMVGCKKIKIVNPYLSTITAYPKLVEIIISLEFRDGSSERIAPFCESRCLRLSKDGA